MMAVTDNDSVREEIRGKKNVNRSNIVCMYVSMWYPSFVSGCKMLFLCFIDRWTS